jgi:hypothetical protein
MGQRPLFSSGWLPGLGHEERGRAAEPDDPDWPAYLACTEATLAYRAMVPPNTSVP